MWRVAASSTSHRARLQAKQLLTGGVPYLDWFSNNIPGSYVEIDCMYHGFSVKKYLLKPAEFSGNYPVGWVLEASNDRERWTVLDEHARDSLSEEKMFEIQPTAEFYRYIRITQTERNSDGTNVFCLHAFRLFGEAKKMRNKVSIAY